jgi:O-antigen/teichoic acid export membrane protein
MGLFGPVYALTQLEIGNAQLGRYRKRIATLAGGPAIVEFVVGLVLLLVRQFHLATVVAATVLAEMVRNGSALFWYLRDRGRFEGNSISGPKSGTQFLQSSLIAAPAVLVPILASNLDSIIYGSMLGPSTLGMYAVAKLGFTVLVLASITAEGYVVAQWAHRRPIQVFARFVLIGLPSSVVVAVVGYLLFPYFFGSAFQEARLAFPLAVLAGLFGSIFVCFLSIAAFNDRHRAALNAASISVVALGVGAILISVLGRPSASDMCLVLLAAQIVGVLLITFRMSPAISISPTTTRISR